MKNEHTENEARIGGSGLNAMLGAIDMPNEADHYLIVPGFQCSETQRPLLAMMVGRGLQERQVVIVEPLWSNSLARSGGYRLSPSELFGQASLLLKLGIQSSAAQAKSFLHTLWRRNDQLSRSRKILLEPGISPLQAPNVN